MRLVRVVVATAVLSAVMAATGPVGADPSPPFPRLPVYGDDGDAPSSVEFNCDDVFAQMVDVQVFQVPPGVTELTFDYVYADELRHRHHLAG